MSPFMPSGQEMDLQLVWPTRGAKPRSDLG